MNNLRSSLFCFALDFGLHGIDIRTCPAGITSTRSSSESQAIGFASSFDERPVASSASSALTHRLLIGRTSSRSDFLQQKLESAELSTSSDQEESSSSMIPSSSLVFLLFFNFFFFNAFFNLTFCFSAAVICFVTLEVPWQIQT